MSMTRLETERLILAPWEPDDWLLFKPIATDPQVMHFITGGRPWADDEIRNFAERNRTNFQDRGFCRWKLVEKASGDFIGFCGLGFLRDHKDPEIGWWLAHDRWGKGLASEAARAAFADALDRVGLKRIISIANPDNHASTRIMQKLGFRLENRYEYAGKPEVMYVFDADVDVRR
jgi:[ribosomal protein S5]-alanine N-acetyltransferase